MSCKAQEHRDCIRDELRAIRPGAVPTAEAAYMERVCLLLADILEELESSDGSTADTESSAGERLSLRERIQGLLSGREG